MAQPCPAWVVICMAVDATAWAMGASSSTTAADLPPSSRKTRLRLPAAAVMTRRPVAVEPVKLTRSTRGSSASCWPTSWPADVTTLRTPAGMSVSSSASLPSSVAHHGVSGAGLSTTVFPAARAGATLARLIWLGKFHGVMAPTTPVASRWTKRRERRPNGSASPRSVTHSYRSARSATQPTPSTGVSRWGPCVNATGAPTSATVVARRSSACFSSACWSWRRQRTRNTTSVAQLVSSKARRAAAIAASMSGAPPSAATPMTCSRAGSTLS